MENDLKNDFKGEFLALAIRKRVLKFGRFQLKSGRISPYFFNAGEFSDGDSLAVLGRCYAQAIQASGLAFDMLFGPAYKGIPLAASIAIALSDMGVNVPWAYNRKEVKDHGEGGNIVGAPLQGRVLIVDDVISAGTSVRESIHWIEQAGAELSGVAIALDRQERGPNQLSAVQEVKNTTGAAVISIASLDDLIAYLENQPVEGVDLQKVYTYRDEYGA